jgi:mono/diheme cytochrome c family protein
LKWRYHGDMKKYSAPIYLILLISTCLTAAAQTKVIKEVAVRPAVSNQGVDLYHQYCSVCHGKDGKGAGPAADALKTRPTDLTQIAHRNNGKFNELEVKLVIEGQDKVVAHGTTNMPVWGTLLRGSSDNWAMGELRVQELLKYVEKMQAK